MLKCWIIIASKNKAAVRAYIELSRAHTPCTASASIWELQEQHWSTCICLLTSYTHVHQASCAHAWTESTWPVVGTVDRHGQQKTHYLWCSWALPKNLIQSMSASFSPISMDSLCLQATQMPRSWDVVIFMPTTTDDRQRRQTKPIALPLAHARGVITFVYGTFKRSMVGW